MNLRFLVTILFITLTGTSISAQRFPEPNNTQINDFADMLPDEAEVRITNILDALEDDTGADATIVTLSSVRFYAQDLTVAEYGTALFNTWGVGDADKGDGILLIVFRDDRELRLELGEGYDASAQARAQEVVDNDIVPLFADGEFVAGIEAGASGIADHVVRNARVVAETNGDGVGGNFLWYVLAGIGGLGAMIFGLNKRAAAKLASTPCESCGVSGQLGKSRVIVEQATTEKEGKGERRITCGACGHVVVESYTIDRIKVEKDEFKGGKSKGDGASGKW